MTATSTESVEQKEKRKSLKRDAVEVWQDYQQTGQHVTAQEADVWLEKLENGDVAELPECLT